jgi:uncharacterized protein (DUF2141 family)
MIRKLFLLIFLFLIIYPSYSYQNGSVGITLIFKNLKKTTGYIQGAIYNNPVGWPDNAREAVGGFIIDVAQNAFPNGSDFIYVLQTPLKTGETYAIACFHDENGNKTLDTNWLGIPKEGYGFSNYNTGIRIPSFEECKFIISEKKQSIKINFKYISSL